jgi:hypothetical protein
MSEEAYEQLAMNRTFTKGFGNANAYKKRDTDDPYGGGGGTVPAGI